MIFPLSITNGNIYYQATWVICEKLQFIMAFYVQLTMWHYIDLKSSINILLTIVLFQIEVLSHVTSQAWHLMQYCSIKSCHKNNWWITKYIVSLLMW